jgi:hypothetical protein
VIPCPFVYSNGRQCAGHIVRIEAYKLISSGSKGKKAGGLRLSPRSHYHLFCSEKGQSCHAALGRDDERMKFHRRYLPDEVKAVLDATGVGTIAPASPPEV